jgi:mRNA interferase MazF
MTQSSPRRGDIYWAYLDPVLGSEQKGRRPVVVVSPNAVQDHLNRVVVLPITKKDKKYPTFIPVAIDGEKSFAMMDQIKTLDHDRLKNKIGSLDDAELRDVLKQLREMFSY